MTKPDLAQAHDAGPQKFSALREILPPKFRSRSPVARSHLYEERLTLLILTPSVATANMADPFRPGDPAAEPRGGVANLAVEKEHLTIDLRELSRGGPAQIEAIYHIRNDGPPQPTNLQFVAANLAGSPSTTVELDEQHVPVRVDPNVPLPKTWSVDPFSPDRRVREEKGPSLFFAMNIPSGRSQVSVAYPVKPWVNPTQGSDVTLGEKQRYSHYGVPYVLEPAREWGEFGTLEVQVLVPDGWQTATSLNLEADESGRLRGTFDGVPDSPLLVYARPGAFHSPRAALAGPLALLVLLLSLVGIPIFLVRRLKDQRQVEKSSRKTPRSLFTGLLLAFGTGALGCLAAPLSTSSRQARHTSTPAGPMRSFSWPPWSQC